MCGTKAPNAAAPLDERKDLRSMQIIGGFHSPAEKDDRKVRHISIPERPLT
jgi:hypothetical protein